MPPTENPAFALIGGGTVDPTGGSPGDVLQGCQGCKATQGSTGVIQIDLDPEYAGLTSEELMVIESPGYGTAVGNGGITVNKSSLTNGTFNFNCFRQDTVPPSLVDAPVTWLLIRKYKNR